MTAVMKTGSGTITRIDAQLPFLEYEFTWNDRTTQEKKSAKCQFMVFDPKLKDEFKTTALKIGDVVTCEYEQNGWDKVLLKAGLKPAGNFGGGGNGFKKPYTPTPREDPQLALNRNYSILHEAVLDKALDLVKHGRNAGWSDIQIQSEWTLVLELTKTGAYELYTEIEKKHRFQEVKI